MPAEGNVGIAFALVIGAGLSTTLGASAAFFAKLAHPRTLAIGLGLSAGVMLYVSFVEIFMQKGVAALDAGGWGKTGGYRYGSLLFFGGMIITALLDVIVHAVSDCAGMRASKKAENITEIRGAAQATQGERTGELKAKEPADLEAGVPAAADAATDDSGSESPKSEHPPMDHDGEVHLAHRPAELPADAADAVDMMLTNDHHRFGLQKMGVMTALAIGIHNLPEGLATFVAALADPLNGVAIAVAIALHNIPEGVCVAMPVYYATGSRWKGFMWAFISGLSEPLGGLLGYLVLYGNRMSELAYGILFAVVAGMMTYISIKELVPTALKYDPNNKVTSTSIIAGMVIMSASLLLFTI